MRWGWSFFGLLLTLTALAGRAAADSSSPNALSLTFGRCDLKTKVCQPHPGSADAEGGPEFQSLMVHCFTATLGRPVHALGLAEVADGFWLDISLSPPQAGGAQMLTMALMRDADSLEATVYFVVPEAESYEDACHRFSERIRADFE